MQIKRFEAQDMTAALRSIKAEFGPEAVILSARSLKPDKGILGIPKRPAVEVTAAIDCSRLQNVNKMNSVGPGEKHSLKSQIKSKGNKQTANAASFYEKRNLLGFRSSIRKAEVKPTTKDHILTETLQRNLIFRGVDKDIANKIIANLTKLNVEAAISHVKELKPYLPGILKQMGIIAGPLTTSGRAQKIIALMGPTGVGKTSTIAKLAAGNVIQGETNLALLSTDQYRIGALEELRAYARIIGVSMGVASNRREVREFIRKQKDKNLILIDTTGVSQKDDQKILELSEIFGSGSVVEIHLVMSATTKEEDLIEIMERFSVLPIKRLIFTKLDETSSYSALFNLSVRSKIPVSFLTNGQEVPEDIEVASVEKLSSFITGQSKNDIFVVGTLDRTVKTEKGFTAEKNRKVYIANRISHVFHCPDCRWVKKIKKENLVIFKCWEEVTKSHLKPCSLCHPSRGISEETVFYYGDDRKRAAGA